MAAPEKGFDFQEMMDSINSLDMENIGSWPMPAKIAVSILVLLLVLGGGYYLNITELNTQLNRAQSQEKSLMQQYEAKAYKAKNIEQLRKQLADMRKQFGTLLEQLPKDIEVPGLLEDITHTGEGSGLSIEKIDLQKEIMQEFYAELPINIVVSGSYHDFGNFVSGVASLPRIVTLHDFSIKHKGKSGQDLTMNVAAETYRYVGSGNK